MTGQLTIAGQMRFTVAQNHQAIQDLTAAMEKHSIELVEYISQDEEGMKVWMKDMGRDVESLRVDMADLPSEHLSSLQASATDSLDQSRSWRSFVERVFSFQSELAT